MRSSKNPLFYAILLASFVQALACAGSESQGEREDLGPDLSADAGSEVGTDAVTDTGGDDTDVFVPTCLNECSDPGATDCDGNSVITCGQYDDDACLEWGEPLPCGAEICSAGRCADTCLDECPQLNQKRCAPTANAVQVCKDHDADGCLEWGGDADCGAQICAEGFCADACTNECTQYGARECVASGYHLCGDPDQDGCLEWGDTVYCELGQVCSNGYCADSCTNECLTPGARKCNGNKGYQVCADSNTDGCLDWGPVQGCGETEVCSSGYCQDTCESECTLLGAKQCVGPNSLHTCTDPDGTGCLKWGTPLTCGEGLVCSAGKCVAECLPECTADGAKQCSGTGYQVCGDPDGDGCLGWGNVIACADGLTCSNGACVSTCVDECTVVGSKQCANNGQATQLCGDPDGDGCLAWGTPSACPDGSACFAGNCQVSCTPECTADGARKCNPAGTGYQVCGDADNDGCLTWGSVVGCATGLTCSNGICGATCENECTVVGGKVCENASSWKQCGDHNQDTCLDWGTPTQCPAGSTCSAGVCVIDCQPECTVQGAKQCDGSGKGVQTCGDANDDGCFEWSTAELCPEGTTCSNGACAVTCEDECTVLGGRECAGVASYKVCDDPDDDGCLEWGTPVACNGTEVCSGGACALGCVDECDTVGARQCNGAHTAYQLCDDHDTDGCLEWGTNVACGPSQVCAEGNCTTTCVSECATNGERKCNLAGTGFQTCADANLDGCLDWGTVVACGATEACQGGVCVTIDPPGVVLLSEVVYNSAGNDANDFVELWGEPGVDLGGFRLVGVNGANGVEYNIIELTGTIPPDGFFVVAQDTATGALLAVADQIDAKANYQNGPDSIQLRWGDLAVDAVGYGSFSGAHFAGEGSPVANVAEGHSISRDDEETDTNDNATDWHDRPIPTPGTWNGSDNQYPNAVITCPTGGETGDELTFDAAGSTDPDGTISTYAFDFGDSSSLSTTQATAKHAYTTPGTFTVTLTVTDNKGAIDTATCNVKVADASAPEVVFVKPVEDLQVTQGSAVSIEIDATPAPGRSIVKVELLAGGQIVGAPDVLVPYQFVYAVPAAALTDSTIVLKARATDNLGSSGESADRQLFVRNDPPVASFSAIITGTLQVSVDASGVHDTETPAADLEVQWDWENDGTWDTGWSKTKTATHVYATGGEHVIAMRVRDGVLQTTLATRSVDFQLVLDVSGEITSTMWMGTVNVTGDSWVKAGETLTIASGTTIIFYEMDNNADGVGDVDLDVRGKILVQGTAENPVIFTSSPLNGTTKVARQWNKLLISSTSSGSVIDHAVIEYADIGLDVRAPAAITNSELRHNRVGLSASSVGTAFTLDDCDVHDNTGAGVLLSGSKVDSSGLVVRGNGDDGVKVTSGSGPMTFTGCALTQNEGDGLEVVGATGVSLDSCSVTYNRRVGTRFQGSAGGTITHCQIKYNDEEGVRAEIPGSGVTGPVVEWNNIFGNGAEGALVIERVNLTASQSNYGTANSATWSTPAGEPILWMEASFSESDYYDYYVKGYVKGSGGSTLASYTYASGNAWTDVRASNSTSVSAQVTVSTSGYSGSVTIPRVAYVKKGAARQVTVLSSGQVLTARHDYLGAWPDVLSQVTYPEASHLNVQGFVGVPFDDTWSPGIYRGAETIEADALFAENVYITGDLLVASGRKLTVPAGVVVTFVPTDQNADGVGDWKIDRQGGTLQATGTEANPVLFTVLGAVPEGGGYQAVDGTGAGATNLTWTVVEKGRTNLRATNGSMTLDNVTTRGADQHGLALSGGSTLAATRLTSEDNGVHGVHLRDSGSRTLNYLTAENNAAWGVYLEGATGATNALTNSTLKDNTLGGLYSQGSKCAIGHNNLTYNGFGLKFEGTSSGAVTANNIKYNDYEGVLATFGSGGNPTNTFNGNNIFGNAALKGGIVEAIGLSASQSNYGTKQSSTWSAGTEVIEYMKASFSESDYYDYYVKGYVKSGSGAQLASYTYASGTAWTSIQASNATSLYCETSVSTSGYSGTTSVDKVFYHKSTAEPARNIEMSVVIPSGSVDAKANYWGATDVSTRVVQAETNTVDFSGFKTTAIVDCGPQ